MNKLEALQEVITTLLRVKNEGVELKMNCYFFKGNVTCGTVCCVAGWHRYFEGGTDLPLHTLQGEAQEWSFSIVSMLRGHPYEDGTDTIARHVWKILFGVNRPNCIDKQIYVTRWFIAREERLQEYNRIRAMPRKERRRLRLAA